MAWIESHQQIGYHPKTKRLARLLDENMRGVVGLLHFLWWWALDFAPDGDLSKYEPEDIADAAMWEGDANELVEALCKSGYLDRTEDGRLLIHDWDDYAGRLIEQRAKNAERKRKSREKNADADVTSHGCHADVTGTSHGRHEDVTRTSEGVTGLPNLTLPNHITTTTTTTTTTAAHAREGEAIHDERMANDTHHPNRTDERLARVAQAYEREIGALTSAIQQALIEAVDKYPEDWIADAIREAAINNVRKWTYVQRILETWQREGRGATPELRANARARPRAQPKPTQDIDEVLERAKKLAAERGIS